MATNHNMWPGIGSCTGVGKNTIKEATGSIDKTGTWKIIDYVSSRSMLNTLRLINVLWLHKTMFLSFGNTDQSILRVKAHDLNDLLLNGLGKNCVCVWTQKEKEKWGREEDSHHSNKWVKINSWQMWIKGIK